MSTDGLSKMRFLFYILALAWTARVRCDTAPRHVSPHSFASADSTIEKFKAPTRGAFATAAKEGTAAARKKVAKTRDDAAKARRSLELAGTGLLDHPDELAAYVARTSASSSLSAASSEPSSSSSSSTSTSTSTSNLDDMRDDVTFDVTDDDKAEGVPFSLPPQLCLVKGSTELGETEKDPLSENAEKTTAAVGSMKIYEYCPRKNVMGTYPNKSRLPFDLRHPELLYKPERVRALNGNDETIMVPDVEAMDKMIKEKRVMTVARENVLRELASLEKDINAACHEFFAPTAMLVIADDGSHSKILGNRKHWFPEQDLRIHLKSALQINNRDIVTSLFDVAKTYEKFTNPVKKAMKVLPTVFAFLAPVSPYVGLLQFGLFKPTAYADQVTKLPGWSIGQHRAIGQFICCAQEEFVASYYSVPSMLQQHPLLNSCEWNHIPQLMAPVYGGLPYDDDDESVPPPQLTKPRFVFEPKLTVRDRFAVARAIYVAFSEMKVQSVYRAYAQRAADLPEATDPELLTWQRAANEAFDVLVKLKRRLRELDDETRRERTKIFNEAAAPSEGGSASRNPALAGAATSVSVSATASEGAATMDALSEAYDELAATTLANLAPFDKQRKTLNERQNVILRRMLFNERQAYTQKGVDELIFNYEFLCEFGEMFRENNYDFLPVRRMETLMEAGSPYRAQQREIVADFSGDFAPRGPCFQTGQMTTLESMFVYRHAQKIVRAIMTALSTAYNDRRLKAPERLLLERLVGPPCYQMPGLVKRDRRSNHPLTTLYSSLYKIKMTRDEANAVQQKVYMAFEKDLLLDLLEFYCSEPARLSKWHFQTVIDPDLIAVSEVRQREVSDAGRPIFQLPPHFTLTEGRRTVAHIASVVKALETAQTRDVS